MLGSYSRSSKRLSLSLGVAILLALTLFWVNLGGTETAEANVGTFLLNKTSFGANEQIIIELGQLTGGTCETGFGFTPSSNIYIVLHPFSGAAGPLVDAGGGAPNTITAFLAGAAFIDELIGITKPSGTLGTGTYAIVEDACQDTFRSPAFTVSVPAGVPTLPSIAALKADAATQQAQWAATHANYKNLFDLAEAISILGALTDPVDAFLYAFQKSFIAAFGDPTAATLGLLINTSMHYGGIAADPPDPSFDQITPLEGREVIDPQSGDPLKIAFAALGTTVSNESALTQGLLRSLERYQGADNASNADWALFHANKIVDYSTALSSQLPDTNAALAALSAALTADTRDFDTIATDMQALIDQISGSGFTAEQLREAANLGLSQADIDDAETLLTGLDFSTFSKAAALTVLSDIQTANTSLATNLATLVTDMGPVITDLLAESLTLDFPVADAGGPYTGTEGSLIAFDGTGSTPTSGSITLFEWDLDGDGVFDDAVSSASPSLAFSQAFQGLIGLKVTNTGGLQDVDYAPIVITNVNSPPNIDSFLPTDQGPTVEVGGTLALSVVTSDPDGDTVSNEWFVDDVSSATGSPFNYMPTGADIGMHLIQITATDDDPLGGSVTNSWAVQVLDVDLDGDLWNANADCDDADPAVNPGAAEIVGNGKDDDCDPSTLDVPPSAEVCDGVDNDLDGSIDEGFVDTDGDGIADCVDPDDDNDGVSDADEIAAGSDPLNAASTPEECDGVDNDLDGSIDEGFVDTDGDGIADCVDPDDDNDGVSDADEIAAGSDPLNAASTPEECDGVDNDLDGSIDEGFVDTDGDGIADCVDPDDDNDGVSDADEIAAGSDPLNAASTPEECDGVDNDLDGSIDEGFLDTDGDGIADCVDPDDDNDGVSDADEIAAGSDPLNAASTPEECDGVDNDLDGSIDEGFSDSDGDGIADCVDFEVHLVVDLVDRSSVTGDFQTLAISGTIMADITNQGAAAAVGLFTITFFEDVNANGTFESAVDDVLGSTTRSGLAAGATVMVNAAVSGMVDFRDNLIYAFVDSGDVIAESREDNNYSNTGLLCEFAPPVGSFDPVLEWSWTSSSVRPTALNVMNTPSVIDLNDDGIPDVVFGATASTGGANVEVGFLRALNGNDGTELFTVSDLSLRINTAASIAVADIDGDGRPEIIASDSTGSRLIAFEHDGTFKWRSPFLEPINWGASSIADLDGDGTPEIVMGRQVINSADGTIRWTGTGGRGGIGQFPLSFVADLNMDGSPEVVAGNTAYTAAGGIHWQVALPDGHGAIGNFDDDPFPEIVLVSGGQVRLLEHDGTVKRGPVAIPGGGTGGPPTVADYDSDGEPEIGIAGASRYVVFETDGTVKWTAVTQDFSSNRTGSSVFDFDGDGAAEVVYSDEIRLCIYKGFDGTILFQTLLSSCTWHEYPVVADVDADGNAEIVAVANNNCGKGPQQGIFVYGDASDSWVTTRRIWNQHTYHITNVNDDGTIPTVEANNWETFNNFRQNVQTAGSVLASPDLTASFLRISFVPGDPLITARIGNGGANVVGAGVPVAFYDGDPSSRGTLLGVVNTTVALQPGQFEDVTLSPNPPNDGLGDSP